MGPACNVCNMSTPNRPTITADSRGRVSLVKHGRVAPGQMFFIDVKLDGVITLTPATTVPAALLRND